MKITNLCLLILETVMFIFLFVPCVFIETIYYIPSGGAVEQINFFGNGLQIPLVLGIIYAMFLLFILCLLFWEAVLKKDREKTDIIIKWGTRIVAFAFVMISVIYIMFPFVYIKHDENCTFGLSFGGLWYVMMVIQLLAVTFSFVKQKKEEVIPAVHPMQAYTPNNVEELKKYKDLLNQGTITQDEFESKKKQLLGI